MSGLGSVVVCVGKLVVGAFVGEILLVVLVVVVDLVVVVTVGWLVVVIETVEEKNFIRDVECKTIDLSL